MAAGIDWIIYGAVDALGFFRRCRAVRCDAPRMRSPRWPVKPFFRDLQIDEIGIAEHAGATAER